MYEMYHNSKDNKRGVGILISSNLQYTVNQEYRDDDNNILTLYITICGVDLLLCSIYGPNTNDKKFFSFLNRIFERYRYLPIICAGDWNTTYSTDPGESNIDILNMSSPPSIIRSGWLAELCDEYKLSDPFRAIHCNRKEYTYIPRTGKSNRSRLDFFIISDNLMSLCNKCTVSPSLNTDLFDHKSINLDFNINNKPKVHFINPATLNHSRFSAVVAAAAAETYLHHADPDQADVDIPEGLAHVGRLIEKNLQCNEKEFSLAISGSDNNDTATLQQCESELLGIVDSLPVPERFNEIILNCAPDVFLDVLMGNIRNSLISFQAWITKIKNARTSILINNLNFLKRDYTANETSIAELERLLVQQRDEELTIKLRELKTFEHLYNEKPSPLFLTLLRSRATDDLQCIKKEDGSEFDSKEEREKFIVDFFADIYTKKNKMYR
jgi:exonuclease III